MNSLILSAALLVLTIAALSGCGNLTPEQNGQLIDHSFRIGEKVLDHHLAGSGK